MDCKKCGEINPKLSAVCELKAMPGMGVKCAITGKICEQDRK